MNLFVVDDEIHALNYLSSVLKETYPHSEVLSFSKTKDALLKAKDVKCDVAFLDIRMDEKNGIQLARELKDINGDTNSGDISGGRNNRRNRFAHGGQDLL